MRPPPLRLLDRLRERLAIWLAPWIVYEDCLDKEDT
jgi:hypothetical protein